MYRAFPCADYYHRSATRPFLQSQRTQSSLASTCLGKTNDRASDVHIAIRIAVDRRLLLDARKAQTQCPRRWLMASTPLARAVWPHRQPFHHENQSVITQRLTPSPPFDSVSKVRTLQTKVPCVALVNPRLEALCRSGVPAGCPVFSGLQTGSYSLSPACRISLRALGEARSQPRFLSWFSITVMRFVAHLFLLVAYRYMCYGTSSFLHIRLLASF